MQYKLKVTESTLNLIISFGLKMGTWTVTKRRIFYYNIIILHVLIYLKDDARSQEGRVQATQP